jgi:hypothetical protein
MEPTKLPKITIRRFLIYIPALLLTSQAIAHHSGAMFDDRISTTLTGTVKGFQWTNPHCWIQVLVPGKETTVEWSIEMGSPSQLFKGGWRPTTIRVGEKITVVIHPMRDGTSGGLFVSATGSDGTLIGTLAKR